MESKDCETGYHYLCDGLYGRGADCECSCHDGEEML
jgi:hypothetical protein